MRLVKLAYWREKEAQEWGKKLMEERAKLARERRQRMGWHSPLGVGHHETPTLGVPGPRTIPFPV